jgi:uncharacterized DUF497 family protein
LEPYCIWDMPAEPEGNVAHIAEHGLTIDEVESVLHDPDSMQDVSRSSGRPITFGMTNTGRYIAVVWENVDDDPWTVYVVTAYEPTSEEG